MKKFLLIAAALLMVAVSCGQKAESIRLQTLTSADIPGEIGYQGDLIEVYGYTDNTGENIVMLTETDVMQWGETEDGLILSNKTIFAYRFLKNNDNWEEVWRVYEMEFECEHYPIAEFVKGALSVTDLDNDGIAEIWLMYVKSCKGGVDPDAMFLRMYDNEEVYTMKGETKLELSDGTEKVIMGGEYIFDNKFLHQNTPPAFVDFAKKLWEKHVNYVGGR